MVFVVFCVDGVPPLPLKVATCLSVQCAYSVRVATAVTVSPAETAVPPLAFVYQPSSACPDRVAAGRVPYDAPIVLARCDSGVLPPFASKTTVCTFVQCAKSVRGVHSGTMSVASTCVPPTRWVNHPTKACPANVAVGSLP